LAGAASLALGLASAVRADEPKPFELRPAKLAFGWDKLIGSGATFAVLNDSAVQQRPAFVFSTLLNDDKKSLCADADCLTGHLVPPVLSAEELKKREKKDKKLTPSERALVVRARKDEAKVIPPGDEATVIANATGVSPDAEGSYTGTLAIFDSATGAFLRVAVEVVVPNTKAVSPATPVGTSATATVTCWWPWHSRCSAGRTVSVPLKDAKPTVKGSDLALKAGSVGAVSGDHGVGVVRYTGKTKKLDDEQAAIELVVEDVDYPGSYEGKIDLVPDDEKAGDVTIKATVKTKWGWFFAAVLAGIVGETLLLRFTLGNKLLTARRRLEHTLAAIDAAKAKFANGGHPWSKGYDLSEFALAEAQAIADKITTAKRTHFADLPKEDADAIDTATKSLAAGADELDGLDSDLVELERKLKELAERCQPKPPFTRNEDPWLAELVRRRFYRGQRLRKVEDIAAQRKLVKESQVFIDQWRALECQLARQWERADAYHHRPPNLPPLDPEQQQALADLADLIPDTFELLWHVTGNEDRAFSVVRDNIGGIEQKLAVLARTPHAEALEAERIGAESPDVRARARGAPRGLRWTLLARFMLLGAFFGRGGDAEETHEQRAKRLARMELLRGLAVMLLALVLALVTAANALYVDDAWGTGWDYVNAFLWASTAKAALDLLLLPALEQIAGLRPLTSLLGRR
jgi:hypothetical protein